MRGEHNWGRNSILQLNWVFDEYFVTPELWRRVFEPNGIGCRPVTNARAVELTAVVQLDIREDADVSTTDLAFEGCGRCGRRKYLPITRGPFPHLVTSPRADMAKTRQYFGSGASAFHGVLVSQKLCRILRDQKVRGVEYKPVAAE